MQDDHNKGHTNDLNHKGLPELCDEICDVGDVVV